MELSKKIKLGLDETRMAILGAQILLGFQLNEVFGETFDALPALSRHAAVAGLALMNLTIGLLIAPAAYHRIVYGGEESETMHKVGSLMLTAATVPLAMGLAGDMYVVIAKITDSIPGGVVAGTAAFGVLAGFWYVLPLAARHRAGLRHHPPPSSRPALAQHRRAPGPFRRGNRNGLLG